MRSSFRRFSFPFSCSAPLVGRFGAAETWSCPLRYEPRAPSPDLQARFGPRWGRSFNAARLDKTTDVRAPNVGGVIKALQQRGAPRTMSFGLTSGLTGMLETGLAKRGGATHTAGITEAAKPMLEQ